MKFCNRVCVLGDSGRLIRTVHRDEAVRLVNSGHAQRRNAKEIMLAANGAPARPATPLSLANYMGQRYTYREAVGPKGEEHGRVIQLKRIDEQDRPIFCLSVTDCMVA